MSSQKDIDYIEKRYGDKWLEKQRQRNSKDWFFRFEATFSVGSGKVLVKYTECYGKTPLEALENAREQLAKFAGEKYRDSDIIDFYNNGGCVESYLEKIK